MDTIFRILNSTFEEAIAPGTAGVAIAVIGLNLHFGFTGLLNMGQAGFMLLGAYGMAVSITQGIPMALAVLIGLALAVIFAVILGIPTLKLRGDYLAIVTISAAEIIRYVGRLASLESLTGGAQGIPNSRYSEPFRSLSPFGSGSWELLPFNYTDVGGGTVVRLLGLVIVVALVTAIVIVLRRGIGGGGPATAGIVAGLGLVVLLVLLFVFPQNLQRTGIDGWWVRAVAWSLVAVCGLLVAFLVRSPWGRMLKGVREDEEAMRSLGKNVFAVKMQALVIGGLFGSLGGMVYVISSTVQADSLGRQITFFAYTALLLGGAATLFGPVIGSMIFFGARILIRETTRAYVPDGLMSANQTEAFSYIVVGIALMLLVIYRPQGLLGDKRELRFDV